MISDVTTHIADQLNEFLVQKYGLTEEIVVIADGSDGNSITNRIAITLVNLSLDPILANRRATPNSLMAKPPLLLNFYILISTNPNSGNYLESLRFVSDIVNFFWEKPIFDEFSSPNMNENKVVVEFEDTSINDMHSIFSATGRTYTPSVLYKVRIIDVADQ